MIYLNKHEQEERDPVLDFFKPVFIRRLTDKCKQENLVSYPKTIHEQSRQTQFKLIPK